MKTGEGIMTNRGFTIIELLIVIAIIGILVGVAVPYYNDYIYDARLSTLKQNLATYRQVLNQFRGDNLRGPFLVPVASGGIDLLTTVSASTAHLGTSSGSELIDGPIQYDSSDKKFKRRSNLKYLEQLPVFLNPATGEAVPLNLSAANATGTAWFYDCAPEDGKFNIDTERAFINNNAGGIPPVYDASVDQPLFLGTTEGGTIKKLDYTTFEIEIGGVKY